MARTDVESAAVEDRQARAAEMVVDAAHEKAGERLSGAQGTPEEIAEEMVSNVDGGDIKSIELERKHAEIIPGQAGSGVQRGSAAAAAQSAVDRASDPSRSAKPVIAQKAEAALAEEIQNAQD
ncbi:g2341 [Coccomyxa elongata]